MATINGTNGADNLVGTSNADTINGRNGNDTIRGGGGRDTITGGNGNDTFVYQATTDSPATGNWDIITDFTKGSDRIDLSALLGATDLLWGGTTPVANGVWYTKSGSTTSIFIDTNGAPGTPEMRIDLQNTTALVLAASDFLGVRTGAAPVITSPAAFSVAENTTTVGSVTATDADSTTLTYSLAAGGDAARFSINATTGALSFVTAPNFEAPTDVGANNVYNFTVQVSDGASTTTQAVAVTVTNVNDVTPAITSPATFSVVENSTTVGTVTATDADSTALTYSLVAGGDAALFAINAATGALNFVTAPNFEAPADVGANNVYNLTVRVSDGTLSSTQAIAVTVTNANDVAPLITSPAAFSIAENTTAVGSVTATDADSPTLTYSIVAGGDGARFAINAATGALSFVTAPNFEAPTDAGADNVYNLTVQASDGTLNTTQAIAVTVTDVVNEGGAAPVFTSPATFSIAENGTAIGTVTATDADSPTVTYSIVAGGDGAQFAINATTGALSFVTAPNFEAPTDAGANNVYNLTVQASDGTLNTTQALAVTVTDVVNEGGAAPVFTSPATFSIAENTTAVGTVTATDADSPTVTYSIVAGGDGARFAINATTGVLSFVTAPNFEAPTDTGADNVYNLTVQASDGALNTTQALAVTVTNVVNEVLTGDGTANTLVGAGGNDTITGNGGADLLTGGAGSDRFVYAAITDSPPNANWATPPDGTVTRIWDAITDFVQGQDKIDVSALLGATDLAWGNTTATGNAVWFAKSGTSTFIYADTDNTPPPELMIELQNTASLTLTANDFIGVVGGFTGGNTAPVITSPAAFSVAENTTAVGTVTANDAENNTLTYSIVAGGDGAQFAINPTTGVLTFVTAPNFEAPTDAGTNNVYNFTVQVSDGTLNTTQAMAVTVTNVNDVTPTITSPATFSIPENSTAVGTVVATDTDSPTLTYSIVAGGDGAQFAINATTGALSFVTAPNFEAPTDVGANNVYNLTVQASDGTLNTTQAIAVTVTDVVNENGAAPVFTSPATFSVAENNTAVGTVTATDADSPTVTYSIIAGGDGARFAINATTGALSFVTAPNFEAPTDVGSDNVYNLTVQASDGALNTTQALAVTVTNVVNEVLTGDGAANTLVGAGGNDTITGNGGADLLTGGAGADIFVYPAITDSPPNANWATPPDGTVTRIWDAITDFVQGQDKIDVRALLGATDLAWGNTTATGNAVWFAKSGTSTFIYADTDNAPPPELMIELQNTAALTLTANDFMGVVGGFTGGNTAPVITSPATFSIPENSTAVGTVTATDADSPTITYSIVAGVDGARFAINATTGVLSFVAAPNFEAPTDVGTNNVYNLTVQASDGTLNTTQAIAVTVTNVNDVAPTITSPAAFSIPENSTAVGTVVATDADSPTLTYSIVAGGDGAQFAINATTGALSFVTAPNFEAPTDAGANNVYNLTVQASDGTLNTTQAIAVTVTDVVNESVITGTPGNDVLNGTTGDDTFDISAGGNDTVTAGTGNDTILAGAAFTSADRIDGGSETTDVTDLDTLVLNGDYAAGVVLAATTLVNMERIVVSAGNNYSLTTADATVVNSTLTIDGSALGAANTLTVNASAETEANSNYTMTGGAGSDSLTGGAGGDFFDISIGGNDTVNGGGGRDTVYAGAQLNATDRIDGGAGTDFVYLNGDYSAGVTFGATTIANVEVLVAQAGSNYNLTMNNGNLAAGQQMTIDGFALGSANTLTVNASAEADATASYTLAGGAGNDRLIGGAGNDILTGNGGNDVLTGGLGNDVFDFNALTDRGTTGDTVTDFSRSGANGVDVLNLRDLLLTFGGYNGSNAFSGGYLQFDTSSGTSTTVRVDSNGGANSFVTLATLTGVLLLQSDTANYVV